MHARALQYIHSPWLAPAEVLEAADVELGCLYPEPIITVEVTHHC